MKSICTLAIYITVIPLTIDLFSFIFNPKQVTCIAFEYAQLMLKLFLTGKNIPSDKYMFKVSNESTGSLY